jgi:tRNA (guanine37-N1)-methyltransferase
MRIDILTTFPEMFAAEPPAALGVSIPGRARAAGLVEIAPTNIRDFAPPPHHKTDDRPFGGGPGMVMLAQPLWDAVQAAEAADPRPATRILMSPQGEPLRQQTVEELARLQRLLIIAGHYEGIDERVIQKLAPREISVGDYVLSGGELAAMVLIDAVIRLLPGALGHAEGAHQESFGAPPSRDAIGAPVPARLLRELGLPPEAPSPRLLDCPHYTRPRVWEGMEVPEALLSGDHQAVARWRLQQMLERTRARRPDLLEGGRLEGP